MYTQHFHKFLMCGIVLSFDSARMHKNKLTQDSNQVHTEKQPTVQLCACEVLYAIMALLVLVLITWCSPQHTACNSCIHYQCHLSYMLALTVELLNDFQKFDHQIFYRSGFPLMKFDCCFSIFYVLCICAKLCYNFAHRIKKIAS